MCKDFECKCEQCGVCIYTDEECEGETCDMWSDCSKCQDNGLCYHLDDESDDFRSRA